MGLLDKLPPTKRSGGSIENGKMSKPQARVVKPTASGNGKHIKRGPTPRSAK